MIPANDPCPTVRLTIDGRPVEADADATVLEVARSVGITLPTLCYHPELTAMGACRLCLVEVGHPDWGGWTGLMAACLYPVRAGIVVQTRSEKVLATRKMVLALLLARCPDAEVIQQLAAEHGATVDRLRVRPADQADTCILCGLCTRVCQEHATSAIATARRGIGREVAPFFGEPPLDCVGCGACAALCPTGHISDQRLPGAYRIWGRTFEADLCTVQADRCMGCGSCEQACPFDVARVMMRRGGERMATIPADLCRGCGVCVGACPTGAVVQQRATLAALTGLNDKAAGGAP